MDAVTAAVSELLIGRMVWDLGDEYGADRSGGMVVKVQADEDGEAEVVVITAMPTNPRRLPSLIVHHHDGRSGAKRPAYEDIGTVARLVRIPVRCIDTHAADDFRDAHKVMDHARMALFAAAVALLPDYRSPRCHDEMVAAFHVLRDTATMLTRGVA